MAQTGNLCTDAGVTDGGSVSIEVCENTPTVCEVYMKKGELNGVDVVTGFDYCNAIGLSCLRMYDDTNKCRPYGDPYDYCNEDGGTSSDHVVRCGLQGSYPLDIITSTTATGLCAERNIQIDAVTQGFCWAYQTAEAGGIKAGSDDNFCEVYMKKTRPGETLNGVTVVTGADYCRAIGLTCHSMYEDSDNCVRKQQYESCDSDGGVSSDHIVRCMRNPTVSPTLAPLLPSNHPTAFPTKLPTRVPSSNPTKEPSKSPLVPTNHPTMSPLVPTKEPSKTPSTHPTKEPSHNPSGMPSGTPSMHPSSSPSTNPSKNPSSNPSGIPTGMPTAGPTIAPTTPTRHPTFVPTVRPTTVDERESSISASSHGDPIIHTFKGDCYDLNKDGIYLATSHPRWGHNVKVAVYNNFIREIQITDKNDEIFWSVSNLNEVTGAWKHGLTFKNRMCNQFSWSECEFDHQEYTFDAQVFNFKVQILFHDYLDDALEEGARGIHLDIYPTIYHKRKKNFKPSEYSGIYFDNPLPEELHYCPADAHKRV